MGIYFPSGTLGVDLGDERVTLVVECLAAQLQLWDERTTVSDLRSQRFCEITRRICCNPLITGRGMERLSEVDGCHVRGTPLSISVLLSVRCTWPSKALRSTSAGRENLRIVRRETGKE